MNHTNWISRSVSRWMPGAGTARVADAPDAGTHQPGSAAPEKLRASKTAGPVPRTTHERLAATLRQANEALSPRVLRRVLDTLKRVIDPRVSEVEGGRRAKEIMHWYAGATLERRKDLWLLMSEQFVADPQKVKAAQAKMAAAMGTPDEAVAEVNFRRATVSPRRRLLQRFSVNAEGIEFLVEMRSQMQPYLRAERRLLALDVEMEYMFSTWFDVGFLELQRISWDSPASLIEKLIQYEAVHDITSWADVKNRLDSDRRCYGFFHPRLPAVPLIFVEVALINDLAHTIAPLLDETAAPVDISQATTAIFYSISNTQPGLRGVSFGDSLIKRVVETLRSEFPKLKTFATLSPIPGFRAWLSRHVQSVLDELGVAERSALGRALQSESPTAAQFLEAAERTAQLQEDSVVRALLLRTAARYLGRTMEHEQPVDPVARFHLGNGARIERLNWAGDGSPKGWKQSYGVMVNYLYDLKRLDKHRAQLAEGRIAVSGSVQSLMTASLT